MGLWGSYLFHWRGIGTASVDDMEALFSRWRSLDWLIGHGFAVREEETLEQVSRWMPAVRPRGLRSECGVCWGLRLNRLGYFASLRV